jgi:hypothetical protein
MASNELPKNRGPFLSLAADMIDGLHNHEAAIGIKQNTEAKLTGLLNGCGTAQSALGAADRAEQDATTAQKLANSNAKGFIATAQKMLGDDFGRKPSKKWEEAGWAKGTTEMPDTIQGRVDLLGKLSGYLGSNAGSEVSQKNFTKAQCNTVLGALTTARTSLNTTAVPARVKARNARDTADDRLRSAMSGLVGELGDLLADGAAEWYYFGLVPPAGAEVPAAPDGVTGHQVGPTSAAFGWPASPRAEKYRPFKKVDGVEANFVELDLTSEKQVLIENLPTKATIHFQLSAYNAAGDSTQSEVVSVTLT